MKKYCLTDCFKRRVSKFTETIVTILVVLGLALSFIIAAGVIGLLTQVFGLFVLETWWFHHSTVGVGAQIILAVSIGTGVAVLLYGWLKIIFKGLFFAGKNLALNIIAPDQAECRIFTVCSEETK